jgi:ferredoxin/flavodoxin---NADP+ reductase
MARKPLELNATLIKRIDLAEGLTIFRVRPEAHDFQTFEPGQYVVLGLNHPEHGPVQRSYSIASPPQTLPEYLDFYVRYVVRPTSENPLTHLLFKLKEGDRLFMGPKFRGKFTVTHEVGADDPRLRVLVAAGTGLAPFTSMVFDHLHRFGPTDQYLVLHGASYPHDMGYREELEKALNTNPAKKRYFPTISRDPGNEAWPEDGFRGRVETLFEEEKLATLERAAGLPEGFITPHNAVVFICGLTGTIANTLTLLLDRGFIPRELKLRNALHIPADTPPSLFFEQYDTEPVLDVKNEEAMMPYRARLEKAGVVLADPAASV